MLGSLISRLHYLRYPFTGAFWRWAIGSVDSLVDDHWKPLSVINLGEGATIHPSVSFRHGQNVYLGANTRVQTGCVLWASPNSEIRIGDHTGLGPGTKIFSSNHEFHRGAGPYYRQQWVELGVSIGENVWVGAGCIILPGVSIGRDSVIAAGAVVTKTVPEGSVVGGIPARLLAQVP